MKKTIRFACAALLCVVATTVAHAQNSTPPPCIHPQMGITSASDDGAIRLTLIGQKQNFGGGSAETRDTDIHSPKSAHITPDGSKFYINSLEGCATVAYDFKTMEKVKTVRYDFDTQRDAHLWGQPSDFYPWKHYNNDHLNTFMGKPVESTFSHSGRYLWVPFYRRTFDINAQDPSALAVIDTKADTIVRLMETGPLPKMIRTSPDGTTIAVSHWGNNTVGLIDISSNDPMEWHHSKLLVVDYVLPLDFPLDRSVDRDQGSGYALRGTVFTPDGRYLLVGCMGGGGGIAVIDAQKQEYKGRVLGMMDNVRHLVIANGYLYLSINAGGCVQRIKLSTFMETAQKMTGKTAVLRGWETCKVGAGARTISMSPDGRYVFACCNIVSKLYVVDTQTMKTVCNIDVDSYPVGLDVSEDGHFLILTSQGRVDRGGNCVDIYRVDYATEPTERFCPNCGHRLDNGGFKECPSCNVSLAYRPQDEQLNPIAEAHDLASTADSTQNNDAKEEEQPDRVSSTWPYILGGSAVAIIAAVTIAKCHKKSV